jgi:hypothetical protein
MSSGVETFRNPSRKSQRFLGGACPEPSRRVRNDKIRSELRHSRHVPASLPHSSAGLCYGRPMKKLVLFMFLIPTLTLVLLGCASPGPDPEQASRESQQRHEADQQQAEFRKDLPPVSNPSQVR